MSLTCSISGVSVSVQSFQRPDKIDQHTTLTVVVRDDTGVASYSKGQPISLSDSILGSLFTGYVSQAHLQNLYPNTTNTWTLVCVQQGDYLAAKRLSKRDKYNNQYSGTILVDQIQGNGATEGLLVRASLRWDELLTDWQAGTLLNTVATTNATDGNVGDGDLELALAGTQFNYSGTLATASSGNILKMTGYCSSGYAVAYVFRQIWTGSISIATGDLFQYSLWIASSSPQIKAIVDFTCSDGATLSSTTAIDAQGMSAASGTDLSGLANDTWYARSFTLPSSLNGKTLTSVEVGITGTSAGTYTVFFRNISYFHSPTSTTIFGTSSNLTTNVQLHNNGYSNVSLTQTTGGEKIQQPELFPGSFNTVGIVKDSLIAWSQVALPSGVTSVIETSLDASASWQVATSGSAIPNLLAGASPSAGAFLDVRATFTLGTDPTVSVSLPISVVVDPSYNCAKSDLLQTYTIPTDFNSGTFTNLKNSLLGQGIATNGFQRNWDDASLISQTLYGSSSPAQSVVNKQIQLSTGTGTDVRSRLDFAGQWQNFIAEADITVSGNTNITNAIVYRTTGWQNANDTYGYIVEVFNNKIVFGYGSNTSGGGGSRTNLVTVTLALAVNSVHRLKVVVSGNSHTIYLDGVQMISQTDSTYTATGYLGLRFYNNSGSTASTVFDNFGVCSALSGTWQSPSIDISGPGTYGNSVVQWDIDEIPDSTCSISAQTSIDGGSTFQSVTNGGSISGLSAGGSLSGKHLIIKMTLTASNAPVVPTMNGVSVWIVGQYSASGTRTSPLLSLASVPRAGTAIVNWNVTTPTNTSLTVQSSVVTALGQDTFQRANQTGWGTSSDGHVWNNNVGSGTISITSDEGVISTTSGNDVDIQFDSVSAADVDLYVRFAINNSADVAGIEGRYSAPGAVVTCYKFLYYSGQVHINKSVAGSNTNLTNAGSAITVAAFYWFRFQIQGTTLSGKIWQDGTAEPVSWTTTTTDSSISSSGGLALLANSSSGSGVQFDHFQATSPITWNNVSTPGGAISGISTQPTPTEDTFATNTSANYTQSNWGGTTGTWTWDTTNSRLTGSGGNFGTIVNSIALTGADNQCFADYDQADGSGILTNYTATTSGYYIQIWDASGTGTQNTVKLFRRSGSVSTQVGSTATISFTRGNIKRFTLDVQAGVITVSMDNVSIITYTDGSPLGAGSSGLVLNTLARIYSLYILQYGQNVSSLSLMTKLILTSTSPTATPQVLDMQAMVSSPDIGPGVLVTNVSYKGKYISDVIKDLTTRSNYWYYFSGLYAIFQARTAKSAPFVMASINSQTIGGQPIGDVLLDGLGLDNLADAYRNRMVMLNAIATGAYTEVKKGDGSTRTWNVSRPLSVPPTSIVLNEKTQTFGIKNVDSGKNFYYQIGSTAIDQDSGGTLLQISDSFTITYTGSSTQDVTRDNTSFVGTITQSAMQTIENMAGGSSSGIVEAVYDASALTVAQAQSLGDQLLQRFGVIGETFQFKTLRSGLTPGMQVALFVSQYGLQDVQFLITQVDVVPNLSPSVSGGILYMWKVTVMTGPNLGTWVKLFTNAFGG